jgi:hypothetical protein
MALPFPISPSQTDAKSPVDDNLMDAIRLDLEYLDSLFATGAAIFNIQLNGPMNAYRTSKKALDFSPLFGEFQPGFVRTILKKSGSSGSLKFDIRRHLATKTPIIGIDFQYDAATQAISNVAPNLATQSITRSTAQITTQSITVAKSTLSINSIIFIGENKWRYNLSGAPDADWLIGKNVLISGATSGVNNGTFELVETNNSGFPSIVVRNNAGVSQTTAAGTVQLQLFSYNFINPVSTQFTAGEIGLFQAHTAPANDGSFEIAKINSGGNNIWVYNSVGVVQGAPAGTADVNRWKYGLLSPSSGPDFTVGEKAKMTGHTSAANNGNFPITALNLDTDNVVVYNPAGVVQGGVLGNINTNRWIYSLPTDPSSQINSTETVQLESHTAGANNGVFTVVQVNRSSVDNIVVYNENGVAQAGIAGNVRTTRKIVKFSSDQAANYSTLSFVELIQCPDSLYNYSDFKAQFPVLEVNRGGGSNFNIVIDVPTATNQLSPAGFVSLEAKSIFTSVPTISVDLTSLEANQMLKNTFTNIVSGLIPAATPLALYVLEVPLGIAEDFSVTIH